MINNKYLPNVTQINVVFVALFMAISSTWWWLGQNELLPVLPFNASQIYSAFDVSSDDLIYRSLKSYAISGDSLTGGFMLAIDPKVHIAAVRSIDGHGVERDVYPYISHFGLQYHFLKVFTFGRSEFVNFAYGVGCAVSALGLALVAVSIAAWAREAFSTKHAVAVLGVFLLSPMILERAFCAYWFIFLSFLPFLATLHLYPRLRSGVRFAGLCGIISFLVCLKALTGYEYMTTIALSAAVPIVFYETRSAEGQLSKVWQTILVNGALIGLACSAGFLIAVIIHVCQASEFFGSWSKGIKAIVVPFNYSTIGDETGIRSNSPVTLASVASAFVKTIVMRNGVVNLIVFGLILYGLWRARRYIGPIYRANDEIVYSILALGWALLAAFAAGVSWELIALKHAVAHSHINWITMYLPFTPLAAVLAMELMLIPERVVAGDCAV